MENVVSRGVTGSKAKFIIDLGKHSLSFTTKLQDSIDPVEANLPSEASIDLPNVHITAEYIQVNILNVLSAPIFLRVPLHSRSLLKKGVPLPLLVKKRSATPTSLLLMKGSGTLPSKKKYLAENFI